MKKSPESISVPQPEFSEWLIKMRQGLNLSKADLIRIAHNKISARTIKNLEGGKQANFRENTLIELASALNITFGELLEQIKKLSTADDDIRRYYKNRHPLIITIVVIIILAIAIVSLLTIFKSSVPVAIRVFDGNFSVIDAYQNVIFTKRLVVSEGAVCITDLNNDDDNEVIIGTSGYGNESTNLGGGHIIAFDCSGKELWRFHPFNGFFYKEGGHTDKYNPVNVLAGHFMGNETKEIIATFREVHWSPSCIVTLNSLGDELSRYWNPGVIIKTIYNKANNLVLMHCVNNRLKENETGNNYPNCLALFNANDIQGQAPPYNGNGPKKGSHLWYLEIKPNGSKIRGLDFVDYGADNKIDVRFKVGELIYYTDINGKVLDRLPSDNYRGKEYDLEYHR